MTYCHVSRQIADHAEEMGRQEEYDAFVDACVIELADTGSVEVSDEVIKIGDVINEIGDDPSYEQAYMEILQGNTKFLESIMDRIARGMIQESLK